MKKRLSGFIFVLLLVLSVNRVNVSAAYQNSGRSCVPKFTFEQLAGMYDSIRTYSSLYASKPTISGSKYVAGTLSSAAFGATSTNINYYRFAAGLLPVSFNSSLNNSAAYGALINAANNDISHTPRKPSGMSKSVYNKSYYASSHSNLCLTFGLSENRIIKASIDSQIRDYSGDNLYSLGHRRWLLNPGVSCMGIGAANKGSTYVSAIRVMGDGVTSNSSVNDYHFIAWPASGNNLSDMFDSSTPWSITLNPRLYSTPNKSHVNVTLTQEGTGKTWTFNKGTGANSSAYKNYFNVNTDGYSINNCIIFRPSYTSIGTLKGNYIVTVTGITTKSGASTSLSYRVNFASRNSIANPERTIDLGSYISLSGSISSQSIGNSPAKTFLSKVKAAKKCLTAVWSMSRGAQGYQVQCSTSRSFKKGVRTIKIAGQKSTCKIKKLKSKKKYYTRVRAYRKVGGKTYFSAWSGIKTAKAK